MGPCEALLPATDRVAEGVGDERQVGVMPRSSSQGRRPYQSPSRCSRGRSAERAYLLTRSGCRQGPARRPGRGRQAPNRGAPGWRRGPTSGRSSGSVQACLAVAFGDHGRAFPAVEIAPLVSCQRRKPPTKALALSPSRHPGGSSFSFLTLPPPRTTYSGSRAAMRRAMTSATCCRHFFLPSRSYPWTPR